MESNSPGTEKSEQILWSSDDMNPGHVRSYTCTFCKRGFSNAQALGGHMNIHRKDRAKLKLSSIEDLSLDMAIKSPSNHPQASAEKDPMQPESIEEDQESCTLKGIDGIEELRQLPLFADGPSASNDLTVSSSHVGGHEEKRIMELSQASSQTELDLELRLGPEPHETSATGSRNFF